MWLLTLLDVQEDDTSWPDKQGCELCLLSGQLSLGYNAGAMAEGTKEIWPSSPCPATLSSEQMPL